jgi:hypothetical protein
MSTTHINPKPPHLLEHSVMYGSFVCQVSALLPYDETVPASDLNTRQEVIVKTGEVINCLQIGNILLVSKDMYDALSKNHT